MLSETTRHIYTVSELNQDIKLILENTYPQVWVEGEVSNFSASAAGHFYFSLKDDSGLLSAVAFVRVSSQIKFKIENGMRVIISGKVTAYAGRSQYQVIVEAIEPKGIGSLQLALEQLKARLQKEGLFAIEHKREIPFLPARIGIVTSLQGAAIRDIFKVLDRRFKDVRLTVYPVKVQGEGAKEEIAQAIIDMNDYNRGLAADERIEVMIVGRGGGSIEDLWAFNEEVVARAIYNSRIPVVSAVGHEKDWTIADGVADLRAATPSVAAELVIPRKEDLQERLKGLQADLGCALLGLAENCKADLTDLVHRLSLSANHRLELYSGQISALAKKLAVLSPTAKIAQYAQKLAAVSREVFLRIEHFLEIRGSRFSKATERLQGLSPLNILSRGYSIAFTAEGEVVKDIAQIKSGDTLRTRLSRGEFYSRVTEVVKREES